MTSTADAVEAWKQQHAHWLIECRWGCSITPEACRAYQSRSARYVIHFNGLLKPYLRVNADYLRCVLPEPCPHLISDSDADVTNREFRWGNDFHHKARLGRGRQGRESDRFVNPNQMLGEPAWRRSLLGR
jgi:hypothetical protein